MGAMTLEELVTEYVRKTETVFSEIRIRETPKVLEEDRVRLVVESARRYLDDSRFYRKEGRLETGWLRSRIVRVCWMLCGC